MLGGKKLIFIPVMVKTFENRNYTRRVELGGIKSNGKGKHTNEELAWGQKFTFSIMIESGNQANNRLWQRYMYVEKKGNPYYYRLGWLVGE